MDRLGRTMTPRAIRHTVLLAVLSVVAARPSFFLFGQTAVSPGIADRGYVESLSRGTAFQLNRSRATARATPRGRYAVQAAAAEEEAAPTTSPPELLPPAADPAPAPPESAPGEEAGQDSEEKAPGEIQAWAPDHRPLRSIGGRALAAALDGYVVAARGVNAAKWAATSGAPLAGPEQPRYSGPGRPLIRSSWRNHPWSFTPFFGALFVADPMGGQVGADPGPQFGARLGYDLDHYLGWEARLAFASPGIHYRDALRPQDHMRMFMGDGVLLYYPWGDARWRPYGLFGAGGTTLDFTDLNGRGVNQTALSMPFGVGVKRRWADDAALRLELCDHWILESGDIDSMHNLSLNLGVEFRFGGRRRSYWPWSPTINQ